MIVKVRMIILSMEKFSWFRGQKTMSEGMFSSFDHFQGKMDYFLIPK